MHEEIKKKIILFQRNEITEHFIYAKLAAIQKHAANKEVLSRIAADEKRYAEVWKKYSGEEVIPRRFSVWKYFLISKVLGLTFGLKLMEGGEEGAWSAYASVASVVPEANQFELSVRFGCRNNVFRRHQGIRFYNLRVFESKVI